MPESSEGIFPVGKTIDLEASGFQFARRELSTTVSNWIERHMEEREIRRRPCFNFTFLQVPRHGKDPIIKQRAKAPEKSLNDGILNLNR